MSTATPHNNRFLEPADRPRIAVFVNAAFPLDEQVQAYRSVREVAEQLGAELRFFHAASPETLSADPEVNAWAAQGMLAPFFTQVQAADREHFDLDGRAGRVLGQMAAELGCAVEEVAAMHNVAAALSYARLAQAWAPDCVISFYGYEAAVAGSLTATLLDIPRLMFLDSIPESGDLAGLLGFHLRHCDLVVASQESLARRLAEMMGEEPRAELLCASAEPDLRAAVANRIESLVAGRGRAAQRANMGPRAAFLTRSPAEPGPEPAARPFLVLGAERTGSNMLVGMLEAHPAVSSFGELFNPRLIREGTLDARLPAAVDIQPLLELRETDPAAFHRRMLDIARAEGSEVVGFKLLYYHGLIDNRVVDHLVALPGLRVIHLTREDRLARWVSHMRAVTSDSWYKSKQDRASKPAIGAIDLDPAATVHDFEYQQIQEERAEATFADCELLRLSYEELAADPVGQAGRVLEFLGVDPMRLEPRSKKTGERDPRRLISNWDELRAALSVTPWRHFVERD